MSRTYYLDSLTMNNDNRSKENRRQRTSSWYQSTTEKIEHLYLQFLLVTTLYVMEPWERLLVLSIFLLLLSLLSYSALVYIPFHVTHILQSVIPLITDTLMH